MSDEGGGASVRYGKPWADPPGARDPLRRLRGHLVMPVTVWLAPDQAGWLAPDQDDGTNPAIVGPEEAGEGDRADSGDEAHEGDRADAADESDATLAVGLTVSSALVSLGEPAMLAGLVSPASDLADALAANPSGRFVVHLLGGTHRRLAQHFSGELPAPPELLETRPSAFGPVLDAVRDRIYCRVTATKPFGWSLLVEAEVEHAEVGQAGKGLAWYHGTFHVLES
jgi:3-hydroxy-9,10-secoandrosta-1,3,5(10)-triene-9,17-dione monooxygenase reductase component